MCLLRVINDAPNQASDYDMAVHALQMAEKCDKRELGIGGVKIVQDLIERNDPRSERHPIRLAAG